MGNLLNINGFGKEWTSSSLYARLQVNAHYSWVCGPGCLVGLSTRVGPWGDYMTNCHDLPFLPKYPPIQFSRVLWNCRRRTFFLIHYGITLNHGCPILITMFLVLDSRYSIIYDLSDYSWSRLNGELLPVVDLVQMDLETIRSFPDWSNFVGFMPFCHGENGKKKTRGQPHKLRKYLSLFTFISKHPILPWWNL